MTDKSVRDLAVSLHFVLVSYSVDELMAWFGWTSAQTAMRYVADVEVKEQYKG